MTAKLIDGKAISQEIRDDLSKKVASLGVDARKPGLAVIIVGDDAASHYYVRNKQKKCEEVGFLSFKDELPDSASKEELIKVIEKHNADEKVDGILLQLPLPEGLKADTDEIIDHIAPEKDADGLTTINQGKLLAYRDAIEPCTPKGCMELIKRTGLEISGKKAIVIGRSNLVGKPMAMLLSKANATVTLAHSRTQNLEEEIQAADIVVAAIGRKEFVKGSSLKDGAVVIDVGINAEEIDGKKQLSGDVDFAHAQHVLHITPVPGGVGPMTIAMLLVNTWELYCSHNAYKA